MQYTQTSFTQDGVKDVSVSCKQVVSFLQENASRESSLLRLKPQGLFSNQIQWVQVKPEPSTHFTQGSFIIYTFFISTGTKVVKMKYF